MSKHIATSCLTEGVCELTLEARDLPGLECWYRETFGLPVISRDDDRVWLACGTRTRLGLWSPGKKEFGDEGGRHVHFAFAAAPDALDRLAERLDLEPREHEGGDRSLYVRDPEGNVVEVWDFFRGGGDSADDVDALAG